MIAPRDELDGADVNAVRGVRSRAAEAIARELSRRATYAWLGPVCASVHAASAPPPAATTAGLVAATRRAPGSVRSYVRGRAMPASTRVPGPNGARDLPREALRRAGLVALGGGLMSFAEATFASPAASAACASRTPESHAGSAASGAGGVASPALAVVDGDVRVRTADADVSPAPVAVVPGAEPASGSPLVGAVDVAIAKTTRSVARTRSVSTITRRRRLRAFAKGFLSISESVIVVRRQVRRAGPARRPRRRHRHGARHHVRRRLRAHPRGHRRRVREHLRHHLRDPAVGAATEPLELAVRVARRHAQVRIELLDVRALGEDARRVAVVVLLRDRPELIRLALGDLVRARGGRRAVGRAAGRRRRGLRGLRRGRGRLLRRGRRCRRVLRGGERRCGLVARVDRRGARSRSSRAAPCRTNRRAPRRTPWPSGSARSMLRSSVQSNQSVNDCGRSGL